MERRSVRWEFISNRIGVGATGTGMAVSYPCRLYEARAVAATADGYLMLYDHTNRPQNPVLALGPGVGRPDPGFSPGVSVELQNGLYVSFSMGTGGLDAMVGWER